MNLFQACWFPFKPTPNMCPKHTHTPTHTHTHTHTLCVSSRALFAREVHGTRFASPENRHQSSWHLRSSLPTRSPARPRKRIDRGVFPQKVKLGPPVVPFYPFFWGRVPLLKETAEKGTLILTSLLGDLGRFLSKIVETATPLLINQRSIVCS